MMDHRQIIEKTDGWRIVSDRPAWQLRARLAAKLIQPQTTVLELGCWSQYLATQLPARCEYHGCDLHARGDGAQVVDLNHDLPAWPDGLETVVVLGVLEYLEPGRAAEIMRAIPCPHFICSYGFRPKDYEPALEYRDQVQFLLQAQKFGWRLSAVVQYDERQPLRIIMQLKRS